MTDFLCVNYPFKLYACIEFKELVVAYDFQT